MCIVLSLALPTLGHHLFHVLQHLNTLQPQQPGQQDKGNDGGGDDLEDSKLRRDGHVVVVGADR
jgi:hypothetical protein